MRDLLVTILVTVLTFVLLAVGTMAFVRFTDLGTFHRDRSVMKNDYHTAKAKYGDPWQLQSTTLHVFDYGLFPLISVIAGGLIGLFARKRQGLLGFLSVIPLSAFALASHEFTLGGVLLVPFYLILSWTAATTSRHLLKGQASASATP